ncbi:MAG: outer membrane beta-barrel protein [Candidatus Omnitrophota bacterium]
MPKTKKIMEERMNKLNIGLFSASLVSFLAMSVPGYAYMWQGVEITPRVGLEETYDSNITSASSNKMSDMLTNATLGLEIKKEEKNSLAQLDMSLARQMFAQHSEFDSNSVNLNGRYSVDLSKYGSLTVEDNFSRADSFSTFNQQFGGTSGLYTRKINDFDTEYKHDVSTELALRLNYHNTLSYYPSSIQSDSVSHAIGAGVDYSFSSANMVSADYKHITNDFRPGPMAHVNEVTANYRHYFTPQLFSDIAAGVDMINNYLKVNKSYPLVKATLTRNTDRNTTFSVSLEQKHELATTSEDVFSNWVLSGKVVKQLKERLKGDATVFYGSGKYLGSGHKLVLGGVDAGVNYEITKNMNWRCGYLFSKQNTFAGEGDYTKNMVYTGIVLRF